MATYEQGELFSVHQPGETLSDDPELIACLDRLDIMQHQEGFLPTSRRELNEAFSLLTFAEEPGGAAKHLAEVSRHQVKHQADAGRTLTSITNEYATYARRARMDKTQLLTLQEELAEADQLHQFSSPEETVYTGLGQLVRHIDLTNLARAKNPDAFPFSPLRGYTAQPTPDAYVAKQLRPEVQERIAAVLAGTRKWEAERWTAEAIKDQSNRYNFWMTRIGEVAQYQTGPARAVARQALSALGIKEQDLV